MNVKKTFILHNCRQSLLEPYESTFILKENPFKRTCHHENLGLTIEDEAFIQIMGAGLRKDADGHWKTPLPFKEARSRLQNIRDQALKRARSLDLAGLRNRIKKDQVLKFMRQIFDRGHAELAQELPRTN